MFKISPINAQNAYIASSGHAEPEAENSMTVAERIFGNFDFKDGPASLIEIEAIEARYRTNLALEVKKFYLELGWGEGFAAPAADSELPDLSEFVRLNSPREIVENWSPDFPAGFIAVGSNGAGEMILAHSNGECGLLPAISDYSTDYLHVAASFETFLEKAELGTWFEDV